MTRLLIHAGIFLAAQVIFATVFGYSWPWEVLTQRIPITAIFSSIDEGLFANISRIWTVVLIIDIVWTVVAPGKKRETA